jgi:Family of unknown function (DUF5677)
MSKIETEGFISQESENWKTHFITKYKDAFQFYRNLNKYVMLFLNKLSIKWDDQYRLIVNTLILRVVENFQAIYLLLERGMLIPTKVITRANLETLFILSALEKKPELLQCYKDQHEEAHKRYLKGALQFENDILKASAKKADIEKLYIKKKNELKNKELTILKPKQWAMEAGLVDFYNLYYSLYSNATHSNPSALDDHVEETAERIDISYGPSDSDLYDLMHCNLLVLINAMHATALINNENISKDIEEFKLEINKLDGKYIKVNS